MKIANPEKRLRCFWGEVDNKHIKSMIPFVKGKNVLDVGCGYGSTTRLVSDTLHANCIGIDDSVEAIDAARSLFPGASFKVANCRELPFEDGYCDTIILRDTLHHLFEDPDYGRIKEELARVSHSGTVLIILDPNVNMLLRMLRFLSSHDDAVCTFDSALKFIEDLGFELQHGDFHTIYSLPISGGYVGLNFVPNWTWLYRVILGSERFSERIAKMLGLHKALCIRYLLVARKP